ncbi:MAG: MFS transporter [Gemmataceae bacterium]|nr:MFS transporter [Gemmataceae bacterium]
MSATGTVLDTPIAPQTRQTPLPGARAALVLLLAINLFNYIDRQVLAAVVPQIEKEFAPVTEAQIGSLATAFMVSYMVLAPVFGWLADRMSRWLLIAVGVILWSLASGASGWAPTFLALLVTRCFVGIGEAAYGPAAPTVIADLYPVKIRGSVLAWFYMAIPVGSALGYVLGGMIGERYGWRWAFYLVVPPGVLLGVWCFVMREPPRGQAELSGPAASPALGWKEYRTLLETPSYVLNTLGMTAMTFALGGIGFWMPRYIHTDRGQPDLDQVNLIFGGIVVVAGLGSTLLGGMIGDKLRARYPGSYFLVSGVSMMLGFPLVLLVLWTPFPWAWLVVFLAVFSLFFNTGPTNTILANVTHPAVRASGFALNIFVIHALGDAISPPVIGFIASHSNMDAGFFVVSLLMLLGGLFWLWGARYLERDTALAPARLRGSVRA